MIDVASLCITFRFLYLYKVLDPVGVLFWGRRPHLRYYVPALEIALSVLSVTGLLRGIFSISHFRQKACKTYNLFLAFFSNLLCFFLFYSFLTELHF